MTCDIAQTAIVDDLFQVPAAKRDDAWRAKFFEAVVDASLAVPEPRVSEGPDGFPYAGLLMPDPYTNFEAWSISTILEPCTENGFGIAIDPKPDGIAEWVFTYGDLVSLRMFGKLEMPRKIDARPEAGIISAAAPALVAAPSDEVLPGYCRKALRAFMREKLGVAKPGVASVVRTGVGEQELMFSIFPDDFPTTAAYQDAMYRISWFLPKHYIYLSASRDSNLVKNFQDL
jgi:hypothetical protein